MKLLCTGDFHLGAGGEYGREPHGSNSRLADQETVLEKIAELAQSEDVDAVLFAGDAFERRTPTPTEIAVWQDFAYEINNWIIGGHVGIDGNHDVTAAAFVSSPELGRVGYHFRQPTTIEIGSWMPEEKRVTIATLPWVPPSRLVASRNGGDRDELHAEAAQLLLESARELRAQIPEGRTSILLLHWSISGAALPSGLPVAMLREPVLPGTDLEKLGFDFVIAGHIHRPQLLGSENAHGPMLYVGSPMCLNFGEQDVEHGVWIIDTEGYDEHHEASARPEPAGRASLGGGHAAIAQDAAGGAAHARVDGPAPLVQPASRTSSDLTFRFVPIEDRPFVTVDVDLLDPERERWLVANGQDETDAIAAVIGAKLPLTDAVVRIRYKATAEQARRVDHAALRGLVTDAGASKLFSVQPEIVRSERARVAGVDEQVEPLAAVELWIENQGIESSGPLRSLTSRYLEEAAA